MITVFTPTYNRGYTLSRLYESLVGQTDKDFEWIIVNDGSTDNTEELVRNWIKEKKIKIRYFKQENQGKPTAHNRGAKEAKGNMFVCVDSDDYLLKDAIEVIKKKWNIIKDINTCVGIVGSRVFENGEPVGTGIPKNIKYSTLRHLYSKYKCKGDMFLVFKTEIVKKYKFPKIEGEKFIPETYLYNLIDKEGELYIIQEGIYIGEYLPDGYTANVANVIRNSPKGYILLAEQKLEIAENIKEKVIACAKIILGNWLANQKGYWKNSSHKILMVIALPLAYYIYLEKYNNLYNKKKVGF